MLQTRFYLKYAPDKLDGVDQLLEKHGPLCLVDPRLTRTAQPHASRSARSIRAGESAGAHATQWERASESGHHMSSSKRLPRRLSPRAPVPALACFSMPLACTECGSLACMSSCLRLGFRHRPSHRQTLRSHPHQVRACHSRHLLLPLPSASGPCSPAIVDRQSSIPQCVSLRARSTKT